MGGTRTLRPFIVCGCVLHNSHSNPCQVTQTAVGLKKNLCYALLPLCFTNCDCCLSWNLLLVHTPAPPTLWRFTPITRPGSWLQIDVKHSFDLRERLSLITADPLYHLSVCTKLQPPVFSPQAVNSERPGTEDVCLRDKVMLRAGECVRCLMGRCAGESMA